MEDIKCWIIKDIYHSDQKQQLARCRKCAYYLQMNKNSDISSDTSKAAAIIKCAGSLNNDRTRALEKVWGTVKTSGKLYFIIDISEVTNIYSCAMGLLVRMYKEIEQLNGHLIVAGANNFTLTLLKSLHLDDILHLEGDLSDALSAIDDQIHQLEEEKRLKEEAEKEAEAARIAIRKRAPCWEYFTDYNPKNATKCDDCFRKMTQNSSPCWIVDGYIEGISFQFVCEDCLECSYYQEFKDTVDNPGLMLGKTVHQTDLPV
jgi:anti-anti-sigma factor